MSTLDIKLCTDGPKYNDLLPIAAAVGLEVSEYKFVRQQDIVDDDGQPAFPRSWTGPSHTGEIVTQTFNGGVPGRHNHQKWVEALQRLTGTREKWILDLEPDWQNTILARGKPREILDAMDLLSSESWRSAAIAFTFYNNHWPLLKGHMEWFEGMDLLCPDAYWYDRPNGPAWTEAEYVNAQHTWVANFAAKVPSRKIYPFFSLSSSGEQNPLTHAQFRISGRTYRDLNIVNGLLWVACDTAADIAYASRHLTRAALDALRGV